MYKKKKSKKQRERKQRSCSPAREARHVDKSKNSTFTGEAEDAIFFQVKKKKVKRKGGPIRRHLTELQSRKIEVVEAEKIRGVQTS